jgi:hypothetical protein
MRQCAFETPETFLREGLRILIEADDSASYRFLAILLLANPVIFQELSDRWQWTRDEAIAIAQRLIHFSPNFDERMTDCLPNLSGTPKPFALSMDTMERGLEILDQISPGRRILSKIRHLSGHSDERISSKAALMIGKRSRDLSWARRVIRDAKDSRLRANTVESFWGTKTPEVMELFHEYLRDGDNRVVGNAIMGLHTSGDPTSLEVISKMATGSNPKLRMTAAWAMGRIGDAQFVPVLSRLVKDESAEVRRTALRSLHRIHVTEKQAGRTQGIDEATGRKRDPVLSARHFVAGTPG